MILPKGIHTWSRHQGLVTWDVADEGNKTKYNPPSLVRTEIAVFEYCGELAADSLTERTITEGAEPTLALPQPYK